MSCGMADAAGRVAGNADYRTAEAEEGEEGEEERQERQEEIGQKREENNNIRIVGNWPQWEGFSFRRAFLKNVISLHSYEVHFEGANGSFLTIGSLFESHWWLDQLFGADVLLTVIELHTSVRIRALFLKTLEKYILNHPLSENSRMNVYYAGKGCETDVLCIEFCFHTDKHCYFI